MSEAQKIIRDVIVEAVNKAQDDAYLYGAWNSRPEIDPDALAAEIDKALGRLTRQWATGYGYPCPSAGDFVAVDTFRTRDEAKAQSDRVMASTPGLVRREGWSWVSGWSEETP
jgi:hypothetical protein